MKTFVTRSLCGLALAATCAFAFAQEGKVVATVNGTEITEAQLNQHIQRRTRQDPASVAPNVRSQLLDELITFSLVADDAKKQGLDKDPAVQAQIEAAQQAVLAQAAVERIQNQEPDNDALKAVYDREFGEGGEQELKARHILVKEEAQAKDLIKQLDEGADFAELAKEHSTGPSSSKGGDLGWFSPAQMVPEFSEAAQALEVGSYTKEPVKTQFGFHVIKLDDKRQSEPPKFEEVKAQLAQQAKQQQIQDYIKGLRDSADVEIK